MTISEGPVPKSAPAPSPAPAAPDVSVVIPVAEGAPELAEVLASYHRVLTQRGVSAEFLVVLDGVSDAGFESARRARPQDATVRIVKFDRPFGESIALASGFRLARGGVVITVPSYLQIEPEDVNRLLDALDEGLDLVAGRRVPRVDPIVNRLQSLVFNGIMRLLTGVRLRDLNCPLRAMRRKVVEDVTLQGDMVRFLPVLAHRHGFRVGEVEVRHLRERGRAGFFGLGVYVRRFLDVINLLFLSKFTRAPLRFFGVGGLLAVLIGSAICAWLAADYLFFGGESLRNRVWLVVGVVLIVLGVQVFSIGLVGEIIIFTQAKNLKDYRLVEENEESRPRRGRRAR